MCYLIRIYTMRFLRLTIITITWKIFDLFYGWCLRWFSPTIVNIVTTMPGEFCLRLYYLAANLFSYLKFFRTSWTIYFRKHREPPGWDKKNAKDNEFLFPSVGSKLSMFPLLSRNFHPEKQKFRVVIIQNYVRMVSPPLLSSKVNWCRDFFNFHHL